jgi:hypothetical protein
VLLETVPIGHCDDHSNAVSELIVMVHPGEFPAAPFMIFAGPPRALADFPCCILF